MKTTWKELANSAIIKLGAAMEAEGQTAIDHLRDAAVHIDMALDLLAEEVQ
ncbi:MAG TPA: hypothetical protein VFV58_39425 [Blastocatellia bacterium]|jgi:hypothetical protein|nr:hypothetical protein [Blastocatellia bacterium]